MGVRIVQWFQISLEPSDDGNWMQFQKLGKIRLWMNNQGAKKNLSNFTYGLSSLLQLNLL